MLWLNIFEFVFVAVAAFRNELRLLIQHCFWVRLGNHQYIMTEGYFNNTQWMDAKDFPIKIEQVIYPLQDLHKGNLTLADTREGLKVPTFFEIGF